MNAGGADDPSIQPRVTKKDANAKHWFGIKNYVPSNFLIRRYLEQLPKRLANVLYCPSRTSGLLRGCT